ncbi:D-alanyl-D-alanine carboxypeptidase family protein [Agromyces archimandritae]|uniref:D-alanyl-D-alanine carboxypeptidase n=1 Tax=Agromyces archimandritae TaxID=2781962 RepID=A0A975FPD7_9MICO|nr:D-alanyl-D-alanine carboxypeptidase [Agromyces archimandritae]QTX04741.1 D-alanyl-D-alanine carboxypeptidase [Agromyces archimandritae]
MTDPRQDRDAIYRRRRIVVGTAAAAVVALATTAGVYTGNALGAEVPDYAAVLQAPAAHVGEPAALAEPGFGAYAVGAVGFDEPLLVKEAPAPLETASITKVITALVVLEAEPVAEGEAGPSIQYTDADVDIYWDMIAQNGSVAPVAAGSSLSLVESLEAMLLPSGNNYAISITNWAFGSPGAFLERARAWLAEQGFEHTTITDSSGLDAGNTSTATELVRLGELALDNPVLAKIVATQRVDVPELGTLENSNKLLGRHGVDGIKTGTTDFAANLLFSADLEVGSRTITLVGVLLGAADHEVLRDAVAALLDSVAPGFHEVTAVTAGDVLAEYDTPWGDTARARASKTATMLVWGDTPVEVAVEADPLGLAARGEPAGTATVTAGDQRVEVPITIDATIDDPGFWWRLTNPGALGE